MAIMPHKFGSFRKKISSSMVNPAQRNLCAGSMFSYPGLAFWGLFFVLHGEILVLMLVTKKAKTL